MTVRLWTAVLAEIVIYHFG